jgi:outer membrane protein
MKKYIFLVLFVLMNNTVQADTLLGVYVGVDGGANKFNGSLSSSQNSTNPDFKSNTALQAYVALEHFLPLIPNIKVKANQLDLEGQAAISKDFNFAGLTFTNSEKVDIKSDLSHIDYIVYYELFDNRLLSVDFGLNVKVFDTTLDASSSSQGQDQIEFSTVVPLAYSKAEVGLLGTPLTLFAEGSLIALNSNSAHDVSAGIMYKLADSLLVDASLRLGARSFKVIFEENNIKGELKSSNVFAGLQLHF